MNNLECYLKVNIFFSILKLYEGSINCFNSHSSYDNIYINFNAIIKKKRTLGSL